MSPVSQPMSSIKLALLAQQLRAESDGFKYAQAEPIAIVVWAVAFRAARIRPTSFGSCWRMAWMRFAKYRPIVGTLTPITIRRTRQAK